MTKLKITDPRDNHSTLPATLRGRSKRSVVARLGLIALLMTFTIGANNCDNQKAPTIACTQPTIRVESGTCTVIQNPCSEDGLWRSGWNADGFRLEITDEARNVLNGTAVSMVTTRDVDGTTRSICVSPNSPPIALVDIPFTYVRGQDHGTNSILLTIAPPFTVEASASPATISVGDSAQLLARVSGGVPPYFYFWVPASTLDDQDIAAPIARPRFTTTYTVGVLDSSGQRQASAVTIHVRERLAVTAQPASISAGDPSQLEALAEGGTPPYSFTWTPSEGLDDPHRADPIARPGSTTTYNVIATDATGVTLTGSATVAVNGEPLSARASANPSSINSGETSQLDVAVTGGLPPYTYSWSESNPTNSLSDPLIRNPVASPTGSTVYSITVRDRNGTTASDNVAVTVVSSPPPTASFVFNVLCCPTLNLDASASTGDIATYTWDLGWTTASPDLVTTSPTASFAIQEFNRGTIVLTVTDTAGRTATFTRNF